MSSHDGMRILTREGVQVVYGLSDAEASLVGRHWNAVRRYLEYGETDQLEVLDGLTVGGAESARSADMPLGGVALECDPYSIEWHAVRGEVSFESIYGEVI